MPHFAVRVLEESLDRRVESGLITELTEAVVRVYGERARELVVVELLGVPRRRWAVGGAVVRGNPVEVVLHMREHALRLPDIGDLPARLISAITDGVVAVLGEAARAGVGVRVAGVPAGRSGVGGVVV
ncbi:tautomerase family protein [Crossiella cryophila]|uniref:Phenylpyruvate tautomerase PptA (4-oxalocrotonate tautomerase family) n=1 Tax=Crossiella cryophila TaxID=43355 RepID=A0A7W7C9R0_9PSEU|nr:hypothetical protein [Crossiella cryophila]MBB4677170.1 phenylpyruvate tautomerase PptA (4-oxalocrotonate tautomerase family) [Crossiella cryophila]